MKKTVFISFSLGSSSISDYYSTLAEKFKDEFQVIVFSDTKRNDLISLSENIIVKYWPSKRPTKLKDGIFLYKNMREYKPVATISVFGSVNIFLIVGFLYGVKIRIAWISTLTTQFKQQKLLLLRKSLIFKLATNIVANSRATQKDAEQNYRVSSKKIKVLPNSVKDLYSEIEITNSEDSKLIVYVGRLHKSKGVEVLVEAFAKIHSQFPEFELMIIGGGEEEKNLKKMIVDLKIEQSVIFKGNLPKTQVLQMFKQSYLSVVPSLAEAFGYTVIEAMSMKTLVIGSNNTGIKEIIENDKTGLLFQTNNADDLSAKIKTAILQPELRNKLALSGFDHFKNNYEVKQAVERDVSFFKNLIKKDNE
ncbi:glycosyltransferase family 4 protein [Flavobacterium hungaricum]|uniref:Glycosyltransferase family 1 protein n=1 Tax=Flavobacterium hungaricum TaxID=2082725 RepID=A0ABR9TSM2_9FLAO|nr:glycosyltransferase family 4 protein [Flavobacterium hungaricum]MBE8727794.1 glycosyltransferase family 1 protein [Flavobacterium hungaricum]